MEMLSNIGPIALGVLLAAADFQPLFLDRHLGKDFHVRQSHAGEPELH